MPYEIEFAEAVAEHLKTLTQRQRQMLFDAIEKQLRHTPLVQTRNRKPMRPNPLAAWELRIGELRVYYRALHEPRRVVQIAAIGIKRREQVWIGNRRIEL